MQEPIWLSLFFFYIRSLNLFKILLTLLATIQKQFLSLLVGCLLFLDCHLISRVCVSFSFLFYYFPMWCRFVSVAPNMPVFALHFLILIHILCITYALFHYKTKLYRFLLYSSVLVHNFFSFSLNLRYIGVLV